MCCSLLLLHDYALCGDSLVTHQIDADTDTGLVLPPG
jgi:hypothetical protein